jgi:hypothetical protein
MRGERRSEIQRLDNPTNKRKDRYREGLILSKLCAGKNVRSRAGPKLRLSQGSSVSENESLMHGIYRNAGFIATSQR